MSKQTIQGETQTRPHTLSMENRAVLHLTGVQGVLSFDERQVSLSTDKGGLNIGGSQLHITNLSLEDGRVSVEGQIDAMVYTGKSANRSNGLRALLR